MIVFPMAGLSNRFTKSGYKLPKYMLPIWDGFVFDYAVKSFSDSFTNSKFLFVHRNEENVRPFIESRVGALGIVNPVYVGLDRDTGGQAETVEIGLDATDASLSEPLDIFNVDTFRLSPNLPRTLSKKSGGLLEVFRGTGSNWSFVEPSTEPGKVASTAEKVAISDLCCSGFYNFANAELFRDALQGERLTPAASEYYIAPIYNHLIAKGVSIEYAVTERSDLLFCGVPEEYEELLSLTDPYSEIPK